MAPGPEPLCCRDRCSTPSSPATRRTRPTVFYWWLKESVPASLAATIDANNKSQFARQIKPIIDNPRVPDDFVMAACAFGQRLYVIPSRGLTVVRNSPNGNDQFTDTPFLDRLLG